MDLIPRLIDPAFPIVVSGPSGVGKTVLCRRMVETLPWTILSISATTRPPRKEEQEGESYLFYGEERFATERNGHSLAEWAEVHGYLYGTPRAWLDQKLREGLCVVLNIDVQGGLNLRQAYPEALLVFVLPPSMEVLEQRLRRRGTDSAESIELRLRTAARELRCLPLYDAVLVNQDLERAAEDLIAIARGERARVSRRLPRPRNRSQAGPGGHGLRVMGEPREPGPQELRAQDPGSLNTRSVDTSSLEAGSGDNGSRGYGS